MSKSVLFWPLSLFWQTFEFDKGTKRTFVRLIPESEFFVLLKIQKRKENPSPMPSAGKDSDNGNSN